MADVKLSDVTKPTQFDSEGKPIWGAPQDLTAKKKAKESKREQERMERFRRDADKPVNFSRNIRLPNGAAGGYDYINIEALYRGFRNRMLTDEEFLEPIMDRLMAELHVPTNYRPGASVPLHRKPKK